jgi:coenzyme F420-reducing hydrogenase delta subunit
MQLDPLHILEALKKGFDHVLVFGCHIGDCAFHDGDEVIQRRIHLVADLLELAGIGGGRVALRWVDAADECSLGDLPADSLRAAAEMGAFDRKRYHLQLAALEAVLQGQRIRWLLGLDRQSGKRDNTPREIVEDEETHQKMLGQIATDEYETALVLEVLRTETLSVREMAVRTGLAASAVSIRMEDLERRGLAERKDSRGRDSKFRRLAA